MIEKLPPGGESFQLVNKINEIIEALNDLTMRHDDHVHVLEADESATTKPYHES